MDWLFPLTFEDGVLCPAVEAHDDELVCLGTGPSLYRGIREEVRYYFGEEIVTVLDAMESAER